MTSVPRDNLIFELGLFMGTPGGADRAFLIAREGVGLPSNLAGVNPLRYRMHGQIRKETPIADLRSIISPAATLIRRQIQSLGSRKRTGLSSHILFHPVIQMEGKQLWFKMGYIGEQGLYDVSFRLYYIEYERYDDGGPARKWTELRLQKSFIPEV